VYNSKSDAILQKEQEYTHKLIDSYLKLTSPSEDDDIKEEFSNLCSISDEFMLYLKKEDQKYASNVASETQKRQENEIISRIYQGIYLLLII
jgi:hypothetical protein